MDYVTNQITEEDLVTIRALMRGTARQGMQAAELGTYTGKSAIEGILPTIKQQSGRLICVDHFRGNSGARDIPLNLSYLRKNILRIFEDNLIEAGFSKFVNIVISEVETAATLFGKGELDFIFIDADHRYRFVKGELNAWWPKLRAGGVMAGHDFDKPLNECHTMGVAKYVDHDCGEDGIHYGVILAVEEFFDGIDRPKAERAGRIWYATKK